MPTLSEINSAIRDTEAATSRTRSAILGVEQKERDVRSDVIRVKLQTADGERELASMDSRIAVTRSETTRIRAEEEQHFRAQREFEAEWRRFEAAKKKHIVTISELIQQIFKLERLITLDEDRIQKYMALQEQFADSEREIISIRNDTRVKDLLSQQRSLHISWLHDVKVAITASCPDFDGVRDLETFRRQYSKVLEFWGHVPNEGELIRTEETLAYCLSLGEERAEAIQQSLRLLAASEGMACYISKTGDLSLTEHLRELDVRLRAFRHSLAKTQSAALAVRSSRRYLISEVFRIWVRLLKLQLHAVNAEQGAIIIRSVERSLRGPEAYREIKHSLQIQKEEVESHLYRHFAPFHAQTAAFTMRCLLDDIEDNIPAMPLSESMTIEVQRVLADFRSAAERLASISSFHVTRAEQATEERQRHIRLWTSRNSSDAAECPELARMLLASTREDYAAEDAYLRYRRTCS